jgi:hypothetical protein
MYVKKPSNVSPFSDLFTCLIKNLDDCWAMTVLSPSKVVEGVNSSMIYGNPDHALYPAPPIDYLMLNNPLIE